MSSKPCTECKQPFGHAFGCSHTETPAPVAHGAETDNGSCDECYCSTHGYLRPAIAALRAEVERLEAELAVMDAAASAVADTATKAWEREKARAEKAERERDEARMQRAEQTARARAAEARIAALTEALREIADEWDPNRSRHIAAAALEGEKK